MSPSSPLTTKNLVKSNLLSRALRYCSFWIVWLRRRMFVAPTENELHSSQEPANNTEQGDYAEPQPPLSVHAPRSGKRSGIFIVNVKGLVDGKAASGLVGVEGTVL